MFSEGSRDNFHLQQEALEELWSDAKTNQVYVRAMGSKAFLPKSYVNFVFISNQNCLVLFSQ